METSPRRLEVSYLGYFPVFITIFYW
jgi:hypothetical protein